MIIIYKNNENDKQELIVNNLKDAMIKIKELKAENKYKIIALIEQNTNTVSLIVYNNTYCYAIGDCVRLKEEYCNTEEEKTYKYQILNINDITERVLIKFIGKKTTGYSIPPTENIGLEMVKPYD